jgi:hypothetical protein
MPGKDVGGAIEKSPKLLQRIKQNPLILWSAAICATLVALGEAVGALDRVREFFHPAPAPVVTAAAPVANTIVAPHAPPIELGQLTETWRESTKLIHLEAGEEKTIDARDLYVLPYPGSESISGCVGPAYVAYTWQVRSPWPQGGDLEIRQALQGGGSDQVGLGSMGRGTMSPCGQHVFKNNGLGPIQVEIRYVSALDKPPP